MDVEKKIAAFLLFSLWIRLWFGDLILDFDNFLSLITSSKYCPCSCVLGRLVGCCDRFCSVWDIKWNMDSE